jgi:hypothetical protein
MGNDEWNPNAPDLTKEFNDSAQNKNEAARDQSTQQSHDIVTAKELEKLEAERRTPVVEQHFTMGGADEQNVHTQVEEQREARISHIRERLESSQRKFRKDFRSSSNKR